jgi:hypothetical protein
MKSINFIKSTALILFATFIMSSQSFANLQSGEWACRDVSDPPTCADASSTATQDTTEDACGGGCLSGGVCFKCP